MASWLRKIKNYPPLARLIEQIEGQAQIQKGTILGHGPLLSSHPSKVKSKKAQLANLNTSQLLEFSLASLAQYFSASHVAWAENFLASYPCVIEFLPFRPRRFGDHYLIPHPKLSRIRIFLGRSTPRLWMTFIHELAHAIVDQTHQTRQQPHGQAWKTTFGELLNQSVALGHFPETLNPLILKHAKNPRARAGIDSDLEKAFLNLESTQHLCVADLPDGSRFLLEQGPWFIKGRKLRTYYECRSDSGKLYRVNGMAKVISSSSPE